MQTAGSLCAHLQGGLLQSVEINAFNIQQTTSNQAAKPYLWPAPHGGNESMCGTPSDLACAKRILLETLEGKADTIQ